MRASVERFWTSSPLRAYQLPIRAPITQLSFDTSDRSKCCRSLGVHEGGCIMHANVLRGQYRGLGRSSLEQLL